MDTNITGIIIKNSLDDFTLWLPKIPADEPLLKELMRKYENSGSSVRGTASDIMDEVKDAFQ